VIRPTVAALDAPTETRPTGALVDGLIAVAIFSGSLPATRLALTGFDPLFLTFARGALAALASAVLLMVVRPPVPARRDLPAFGLLSLCVVLGFPLLTALALMRVESAHAVVFIGLLPLATAGFGAVRAGERPSGRFWVFACLGSAIVAGFALRGGLSLELADVLMLAAILAGGLGYAEGGRLSRRLGGWPVIAWANVAALPVTLPLAAWFAPPQIVGIPAAAWAGLGYVSLFSMLIGFVFWNRGLARGGIAAVGQLQLLQPFLGLALAALLLGERIEPAMVVAALAVVACVAAARRAA
jgi:drug/metabolite transporter (DMT)-like permease